MMVMLPLRLERDVRPVEGDRRLAGRVDDLLVGHLEARRCPPAALPPTTECRAPTRVVSTAPTVAVRFLPTEIVRSVPVRSISFAFDELLQVALGAEAHELGALLVLEHDLVVAASPPRRVDCCPGAPRLVVGQLVGHAGSARCRRGRRRPG